MNLGVSVAALMTPQMISRRLAQLPDTDKLIVPGLCVGDLEALQQQYGIPVIAIASLNDLLSYLQGSPDMQANLRATQQYREQYGVDYD